MTARQSARIAAARLAYALCTRATVAAWGACVSLAAFLQRQERTAAEDAEVDALVLELDKCNAPGGMHGEAN